MALIGASARSTYAQESLAEILRTMSANLVIERAVPLLGSRLEAKEIARNPEFTGILRHALLALQYLPAG